MAGQVIENVTRTACATAPARGSGGRRRALWRQPRGLCGSPSGPKRCSSTSWRCVRLGRHVLLPPVSTTRPVLPSTSTVAPSGSAVIASGTANTAGRPSSRATIAACESRPPVSVTTAATTPNSGVHAGSVVRHTSTSPGRTSAKSSGPRTTRAGPAASPGLPGVPVNELLSEARPDGAARAVGRAAVTGRACRIQTRPSAIAHSTSCGLPSRSSISRPSRARWSTTSSARQRRSRSAVGTSRMTTCVPTRSIRVSLAPIARRATVLSDTTQESGVTWPPTTRSPSPHDASIRMVLPVNSTPATSASTRRCTSTAVAGGSACTSPACRRRYATARSDHSEAQHPRTASATWSGPRTPRKVSCCPAAATSASSSLVAEERTATYPPDGPVIRVSAREISSTNAGERVARSTSRRAASAP
ncbi:hypothetical protein GA0070608_4327 [Micromonospora peucetia]|uniref:Uncharacterized protein n=1 Tax=Micromonospora peucetia TaxID=47871 RepID=A0A1C6VWZ5_9ACTN|nr:hypothetical protein GA0070608_4327 [Micromonospora peucetia]